MQRLKRTIAVLVIDARGDTRAGASIVGTYPLDEEATGEFLKWKSQRR